MSHTLSQALHLIESTLTRCFCNAEPPLITTAITATITIITSYITTVIPATITIITTTITMAITAAITTPTTAITAAITTAITRVWHGGGPCSGVGGGTEIDCYRALVKRRHRQEVEVPPTCLQLFTWAEAARLCSGPP